MQFFGPSGEGKSTAIQGLVKDILDEKDPFGENGKLSLEKGECSHRIIWYTEEPILEVKPKFETQNIDMDQTNCVDMDSMGRIPTR